MAGQPADPATEELVQIGDLARRTGLSVDVLRAWERRYGLLRPRRSDGGFRLYSSRDEDTVRAMLAQIDRGFPPAQAAKLALAQPTLPSSTVPPRPAAPWADGALTLARADLYAALTGFHGNRAHQLIDELFAGFTIDAVLSEVILPCLADLGDGWKRGAVTIAQEHFASNLLRGRLASLARGWGHGHGPRAVLACPPGERHDLALLVFGIALNRNGWRVGYLGADTPLEELINTAVDTAADLVVLAAATPERFAGLTEDLTRLASVVPLAVAGAGAAQRMALPVGTRVLTADPVTEAERMPPPANPRHDARTGQ